VQQQQQQNDYNAAYRAKILYYIYIRDPMADEVSSAFSAPHKLLLVAVLNLNLQPKFITIN
jgi:hypothetical protein